MTDQDLMLRAIEVSKRGFPAPNPHVGCVIARDGKILSEGHCEFAGAPHAEAMALAHCEDPRGATAYVTLEPCNHFGRTPPCSNALVQAGISRVVVAVRDMNPKASGGIETLKGAGIEVVERVCQEAAAQENIQFLFAMHFRRPMVTVKIAHTLDGKIGLPSGESQWITSEDARTDAQRLRAECGCVLIGRKTAERDRARLTVRDWPVKNQPLRVVLDPRNVLDKSLPVFSDEAETIHVNAPTSLEDLLADLFQRGVTGVMVEGGPTTIAKFFEAGLVDRFVEYVSPNILPDGLAWTIPSGSSRLTDQTGLKFVEQKKLTNDLRNILEHRNLLDFRASYKCESKDS